MNVLTRMRLFALVAILLAPLSACALSGGPIYGKVVEEGTNKPIAGAIVVARWNGLAFSFADTRTVCVHVLTATTDEKGNYSFPLWFKESPLKGVHSIRPTVIAHKPGYGLADEYPNNNPYLKPFTGTRKERMEYLMRLSGLVGCYSGGESEKSLLALRTALYDEARQHARPAVDQKIIERRGTDEIIMPFPHEKTDQEIIESLRYEMEIIEYGYETAERRHLQRLGAEK